METYRRAFRQTTKTMTRLRLKEPMDLVDQESQNFISCSCKARIFLMLLQIETITIRLWVAVSKTLTKTMESGRKVTSLILHHRAMSFSK